MARPEKPLDPSAGPVQRLAHELRELRRAAGSPSYRAMAQAAGLSVATLSTAAAGTRMPSLAAVQGYVRACGGDPDAWERRWKEAEAEAAEEARQNLGDAASPYRGLARFEPDDRHVFFGRDRLMDELRDLVSEHRFAVLFGASGSGKSSLLRAGLIPWIRQRIQEQGGRAVLRILTPGPRPAATYGHLLVPGEGEPDSWVVVDQFEEVFTLCRDKAERDTFIDLLLAARDPDSRLHVLISVRADFYARCAEHRGLADALRGVGLLVGPMTADEFREAVVKPAQGAGLRVERELTARIVEEVLDEPGGLPMFSHALLETWRRRRGRTLTLAAYEAAGGVRGAIAATADDVYGQLSQEQARTTRHLLLRMVEPGRGTADTRHPLTWAELEEWPDPDAPTVVHRLTRARLLTADEDGVQLAHEALITCWPRLHAWIEEDRERLRHRHRLADDTRAWLEHDRDPGALYRGARLARAEELFTPDDGMLGAGERDYLTAAREARDAERRAAARSVRRSRALLGTLSAVLAAALVAGLVAWVEHRDNQRQHTEAAARRLAEVSDALRTTDPRTAQLLGVASWNIAELPETRRALLGALAQPQTDTFTDPAPGIRPSRFLVDSGHTLLSADGVGWRTWDVTAHRRTASGRLPDGMVMEAGPDGRRLAIVRDDAVRMWDTLTGRWTGPALPGDTVVNFGPDGRSYVESSLYDDRVRLRSAADGTPLFETRVAGLSVVEPSIGGRMMAVCSPGRSPQVWDTAAHRIRRGAWESAGSRCDDQSLLVFGGSGRPDRFAMVFDNGVRIWDTTSGRQIASLDDAGVNSVSFSADGAFLATADGDEIKVWRLASFMDNAPAPVFRHPLNNERIYGDLAWDSGRPRLRYLEGGTVHTLDLADAVTAPWRDDPLDAVVLSPDGRTLATAERIGDTRLRVRLRDPRDGRLLRTLPPVPWPVSLDPDEPVVVADTLALMAFSSDGGTLAYGLSAPGRRAAPQKVVLWDVARGRARTTLDLATPSSAGAVVAIALGPSGHHLYAMRTPHIGELRNEVWDTERHRRTAEYDEATEPEMAIRPDGRLLVTSDHTVSWPSGAVRAHNLVQGNEIGALAFAPDGSQLAAGDMSGRVTLWDSSLKHREGVLRNAFPAPLDGTAEGVSALAVSPDGRTLAVGGDAGTLQLWDIATRQPLGGPLTTADDTIASVSFSPDSTTVYAAGPHVLLTRYTIDPAQAVTRICARNGNVGLTSAQWKTYVPDAPYRTVCGR